MCEANSMIPVHSGVGLEFNLKTLQVIPDAVNARRHQASGIAAFGEQSNLLTIGEFDPGSG